MADQKPSVGRIVRYMLTGADVLQINRRRKDASANLGSIRTDALGYVVHAGNQAEAGQVLPMMIVRVWGDTPASAVNGQVLLDGNDTLWVTSRCAGQGQGFWRWPEQV
jgi:hypothetical protein